MDTVVKRVLMIDDEDYPLVKNMLLQSQGINYELRWANSFDAALKEIRSDNYDAVLVDYELGSKNRYEALYLFTRL